MSTQPLAPAVGGRAPWGWGVAGMGPWGGGALAAGQSGRRVSGSARVRDRRGRAPRSQLRGTPLLVVHWVHGRTWSLTSSGRTGRCVPEGHGLMLIVPVPLGDPGPLYSQASS